MVGVGGQACRFVSFLGSVCLITGCSVLFLPDSIEEEAVCADPASRQLVFLSQPSDAIATEGFAIEIAVEDLEGKRDPLFSETVKLRLVDPMGESSLLGTTSTVATEGVAKFSVLSVSRSGDGLRLEIISDCARSALSQVFEVTPSGKAVKLSFLSQPHDLLVGDSFLGPIEVAALDESDGRVTDFSGRIDIETSQADAFIYGKTSVFAVSGVAAFPGLAVLPGNRTDMTLFASARGLMSAESLGFNISGTARYVDGDTGTDTLNDCLNIESPCQTPNHAALIAACGDTILLHGGTFAEPIVLDRMCEPTQQLFVRPWPETGTPRINTSRSPGDSVTIRGSNVVVDGLAIAGGQKIGFAVLDPAEDVTIRSCSVQGVEDAAIFVQSGSNHILEGNSLLSLRAGGIIIGQGRQVLIQGNRIVSSPRAGINIRAGGQGIIRGNDLEGNVNGVQLFAAAEISNNRIYRGVHGISAVRASGLILNNTIEGNTATGILIDPADSGLDIRNNIIANNRTGIVDTVDNESSVQYNLFFGNETDCTNLEATQCLHDMNGNIVGLDPHFVDTQNYYLSSPAGHYPSFNTDPQRPLSPGIDAAEDAADFQNESQNNGQQRNLGAWGNTTRASRSP